MSAYASVTSVGGLLPTSLLERVRAGDAKIPGTTPGSYGLVPGERIGDHVTRSWNRLRGVWVSFTTQLAVLPESDRATTLTRERWCRPLLDELGFAGLPAASGLSVDGKAYPISHEWGDTVPVHIMGARLTIDRRAAGVAGAAAMSPHGLVQEYLNRSDDHLWGIVTNGLVLRVLRDNASLTKQAFVEFDLEGMFAGDLFSDFVVLWLTCHRTRFEGDPSDKCLLEQWSNEAAESGTRALDKLRDGVEAAITSLGSGFVDHPSNGEIRDRLRSGDLTTTTLHHEVLRIVYRLLFLLVAESRDLLHAPGADPTAIERYRRFYSVDRLRTLAAQRRGSSHDDLWNGLTVTMRGLWHDGVPGLGLSPLGSSLWAPDSVASLTNVRIGNRYLLDAVRALCFVRDDEARSDRAVDYKNLGAEELGSVYESLLELHAEVDVDARTFALTTAAGNERKTTGSYYTPTSLISELLDSALDPVLDEAIAKPDPEAALLALRLIDPAAGSGHFLISAAHRIAGRLASVRAGGGEPAPDELRHALRDVVSNCIHAIDINPMAVELCKVSMWLEATEPGKPLSFLDHRIVCGNALLGATPALLAEGIPDDAFAVLAGDDKATVASLKKRNKLARKGQQSLFGGADIAPLSALAETAGDVAALDEESIGAVEAKARRWDEFITSAEYANAVFVSNLWCAAFVVPKTPDTPEITHETYRRALDAPERISTEVHELVESTTRDFAFLHWHLAFLDAFGPDGGGGFDVVLGNPPWDQVQYDPRETFAQSDPAIAAAETEAERSQMIDELRSENPALYGTYLKDLRKSNATKHLLHRCGRFPLSTVGRLNTAPLFVEAMWRATGARGRTGVIVPSGLATDSFTQAFFRELAGTGSLVSFFDFENRRRYFPVHASLKFSLVTIAGSPDPSRRSRFLFFGTDVTDIRDEERTFAISAETFALINPNTGTCPIFRSRRDALLVESIYSHVPVLRNRGTGHEPFAFSTLLMFMGTSGTTTDPKDLRSPVPVLEGKLVAAYDHRSSDAYRSATATKRQVQAREVSTEDHLDPCRRPAVVHFAERSDVVAKLTAAGWNRRWILAWKDITSATNERTMIAAALPAVGCNDTLPIFVSERSATDLMTALATMNSFAFDYVCRQKVGGTHLRLHTVEQLPFLDPDEFHRRSGRFVGSDASDWLSKRVLELSCTDWQLGGLALDLGVAPFPFVWNVDRRQLIRAEIDALLFHLFRISRIDTCYVLDGFSSVRSKDQAAYGEYRTKRLILECYDAMAEAEANGIAYATTLNPPPADPSIAHEASTRPDWADWFLNGADT